ncbi:MAG: glutamate 5-kinase [Rickettsiales bacterium]|jgi:glutamate 5-kinase|nr:glutamate 5-kinase [Rickettsiales bacterium]
MDDFSKYSRIVIKIGSSILIDPKDYTFRTMWLESLARDISQLVKSGHEIIIVASGAIASGCLKLGEDKGSFTLEDYQALAAYGQSFLSNNFSNIFADQDLKIAQILLTIDDYETRRRFLNAKFTINRLLNFGIIPIINENDTVATDEIRFGDNDNLAAKISVLSNADLLIILSDVKGLYDKSPKNYPDAKLIRNIEVIDESVYSLVGEIKLGLGTGGMFSKLKAIEDSGKSGVDAIIASGLVLNPLQNLKNGEYSFYKSSENKLSAKRRWLLSLSSKGCIVVDNGAEIALEGGNSLLAVGIDRIEGDFTKGDIIKIVSLSGKSLGQGIVNYRNSDLGKIIGVKNCDQSEILHCPIMSSVIHVDNLTLV